MSGNMKFKAGVPNDTLENEIKSGLDILDQVFRENWKWL